MPEGKETSDKENSEERPEKKPEFTYKIKKNPWQITSAVLAVAVLVLLIFVFRGGAGGITGSVISGEDAGSKLVSYLNSRTGGGVEYVSYEDIGSLYSVVVSYKGDEIPVYITKDGKYFITSIQPMIAASTEQEQPVEGIPKSDKPEVELFVMTHCPYGTQAEKGIIPVLELLGEKIYGKIRFVHYFMHDPEETETPIQVCIREEQPDKWLSYLRCFLEDGDSDRCLTEAKINKADLDSCIADKSEDYYNEDSKLSQSYGVGGSPTLVMNGQIVSSGRSSAAYLSTICSAFNKAPEECQEELSSANPSSGFGYSEGGSSAGQC